MTRNMKLVQAAASFALTGTGGSCSAVVDLVSVLKGLSIVLRVGVPGLDLIHSSFTSTSATIERRQPCPRMSRRPVTTSQTSHAAKPGSPTNSSGEPSAMARFPAPAKMSKLPPATPSGRCHGRVKPLAWVANAAPMKVAPSAGSASAKAAAWSCQTSSNAGVGSASPPAERTTPIRLTVTRAKIAARVAPAATARRDQSVPAAPRRPTSPWRPVTKMSSSGSSTACRPTAIATASRFCAKASTCSILAALAGLELVPRLVPSETRQQNNEVAGFLYDVVGVVYAVLLAHLVIDA